jgi:hypothetical protein
MFERIVRDSPALRCVARMSWATPSQHDGAPTGGSSLRTKRSKHQFDFCKEVGLSQPLVNVAREFYLFFVAFENFGFSIVPSMRKGNDNLPSVSLAPSMRAKVFVRNPCLVVIAARP